MKMNECFLNSLAGIDPKDGKAEEFCGAGGYGVSGKIYPIPFSVIVPAAGNIAKAIKPKNTLGVLVGAILLDAGAWASAEISVAMTNAAGKEAGIAGDGIDNTWPAESLMDVERLKACLPNVPPDIGLISSQNGMILTFANTNTTTAANITGIVFGLVPAK